MSARIPTTIVASSGVLSGAGTSWSIGWWMRPSSWSGVLFEVGTETPPSGFLVRLVGTGIEVQTSTATVTLAVDAEARGECMANGAWWLITCSSSGITLYAARIGPTRYTGTTGAAASIGSSSGLLRIGARSDGTQPYSGIIGEVAFWRATMPDAFAKEYVTGRLARDYLGGGLQLYFPLRRKVSGSWRAYTAAARTTITATGALEDAEHPNVGRAAHITQQARGPLATVVRVAPGLTDEHHLVSRDLGDDSDMDFLPFDPAKPQRRLASIPTLAILLSDGYCGIEELEPVRVQLEPEPTLRELIASWEPRVWLRGHETSIDSTGRHALARSGVTSGFAGPHEGEVLPSAFNSTAGGTPYAALTGLDGDWALATQEWTVSFWIRVNQAQTQKYVFNGGAWAVIYGYVADTVEFFASSYTGSDPRPGSQITIAVGGWYHVAYVYRSGTWSGYLDGQRIFSVARSFTLGPQSATAYLYAASPTLNTLLQTRISDFVILPRALGERELKVLLETSRGQRGRDPASYVNERAEVYLFDTEGGFRRLPDASISEAETRDGRIELGLRSASQSLFEQPLPADMIDPSLFPLSREPGAPVPIPFGDAYLTARHLATAESSTLSGEHFAVALQQSGLSGDVIAVADAWWDSAPQEAGLERAISWIPLQAVAYDSASQLRVAGDVTALVRNRVLARAPQPSGYGYAIASATYNSATGETTIGLTQPILQQTPPSGVILRIATLAEPSFTAAPGSVVNIGAGGAKVLVLGTDFDTGRRIVTLVAPGSGYSTGVVDGVEILEVGSVGIWIAGELTLHDDGYSQFTGTLIWARLPLAYRGALVLRVLRPAVGTVRAAMHLALLNVGVGGITGFESGSDASLWSPAVAGAFGDSGSQEALALALRDLAKVTAGVLYQAGSMYRYVDSPRFGAYVDYYPGGHLVAPDRLPASDAVQSLILRFGPRFRVQSQHDTSVLSDLAEYPGIARLGSATEKRLDVIARWVTTVSTAQVMAERTYYHAWSDNMRYRLTMPPHEALGIELGSIIRADRAPDRALTQLRVRRIEFGDDAIIDSATFLSQLHDARESEASTVDASIIPSVIAEEQPIATSGRASQYNWLRNSDFSQPGSSQIPSWYAQGATVRASRNDSSVGGYVCELTTTSAPAYIWPTQTGREGDSSYRLFPTRYGWTHAFAVWMSPLRDAAVQMRVWTSTGTIIETVTLPLVPTGERNSLGFARVAAIYRVRSGSAAYITPWLRFGTSGITYYLDAPWFGRVDGRLRNFPPWSRSVEDAGVYSRAQAGETDGMRVITESQFVTIAAGQTSATSTLQIPAGSALLDVTARAVSVSGTYTYSLGVAGDTTRFGSGLTPSTALRATLHGSATFTVAQRYTAATSLVLTISAAQGTAQSYRISITYLQGVPGL